jgi:hypothetical protein
MQRFLFLCVCLAACAPRTAPPPAIQQGGGSAGQIDLTLQAGPARVYTLHLRDRAALDRRGAGPGRAHFDLDLRARISRVDQNTGEGVRVELAFSAIDAKTYGPLGRAAVAAARALEGGKLALVVDAKGGVRSATFAGHEGARALAERLGRTFVKMSPAFPQGARSLGGRWGDTMALPLAGAGGPSPIDATLQASYVYQRGGELAGRPCAVVQVDLRPGGNATLAGTIEGAVSASGSGKGELCLDPSTGALRAGYFDLLLQTEVGARTTNHSRVRPLHLAETRRLRIDVSESVGG